MPRCIKILLTEFLGYACLYKGLGETVNQVSAEEVIVSIFEEDAWGCIVTVGTKTGDLI